MSQENVDAVLSCLRGWNDGAIEVWLRDAHPKVEARRVTAHMDQTEALEAVGLAEL